MPDYNVLKELGLSKTAIRCYANLLDEGPANARELAGRLQIPHSNIYGTLDRLTEQGFIEKYKTPLKSAHFIAKLPGLALADNYMYRRKQVLNLCRQLGVSDPPALRILPQQRQSSRTWRNQS